MMVPAEEWCADFARDLLDVKLHPMDRQKIVKGYARLMELREQTIYKEAMLYDHCTHTQVK